VRPICDTDGDTMGPCVRERIWFDPHTATCHSLRCMSVVRSRFSFLGSMLARNHGFNVIGLGFDALVCIAIYIFR
jgi:hypothetical protein